MEIKFISEKAQSKSSQEELDLFEAYEYNVQNNIALTTNIQKLPSGGLLYTAPIAGEPEGGSPMKGMWSIRFDRPGLMRFYSEFGY
jgi:hypothetical protein